MDSSYAFAFSSDDVSLDETTQVLENLLTSTLAKILIISPVWPPDPSKIITFEPLRARGTSDNSLVFMGVRTDGRTAINLMAAAKNGNKINPTLKHSLVS